MEGDTGMSEWILKGYKEHPIISAILLGIPSGVIANWMWSKCANITEKKFFVLLEEIQILDDANFKWADHIFLKIDPVLVGTILFIFIYLISGWAINNLKKTQPISNINYI